MYIQIITLFPNVFTEIIETSMLRKAKEHGLLDVELCNLRHYGKGNHKQVDDSPYGGGEGMILKVDVVYKAIRDTQKKSQKKLGEKVPVIMLTPQGEQYCQKVARELSSLPGMILLAGHYEGFDERIRSYIDREISIGDYVLTGGEIPAMTIVDSVTRLIPGVLASEEASQDESFENGLLEYPHYTRPASFKGKKVPEVLLSGHHEQVAAWRKQKSLKRTKKRRPDLLPKV